MKRILPSMLACDYLHIADESVRLIESGLRLVHYDVMDGHFVRNISFGAGLLAAALKAGLRADVHLMTTNPQERISDYFLDGVEAVTVHLEAVRDGLPALLGRIREAGRAAGVAINPATDPREVQPYLKDADIVLVMGVEPGAGGQKINASCIEKLRVLREMPDVKDGRCRLSFDGGVTLLNAPDLFRAGADDLVSGSALFASPDMRRAAMDMMA